MSIILNPNFSPLSQLKSPLSQFKSPSSQFKRRSFLKLMGKGAMLTGAASAIMPGLTFAATPDHSSKKYIMINLRGAMDGLHAIAPYGDPEYHKIRGPLALSENEIFKINGLFGLHPAFKNLAHLYAQGEAVLFHAISSPYRSRSHFDGQDMLENGLTKSTSRDSGWLGRLLKNSTLSSELSDFSSKISSHDAVSLTHNMPLILQGGEKISNWAPSILPDASDDLLSRISALYEEDELLKSSFNKALRVKEITDTGIMGKAKRVRNIKPLVTAALKFLTAENGPNIAVIESSGWDTHAAQGRDKGRLAANFKQIDDALRQIRQTLGDDWNNTAITIVTEFGRTAAVNGSIGTDHGTASAAFLVGGAVNGGKIITDWPGLKQSNLYEGRDLNPTNSLHSLFKATLRDFLGVNESFIENDIFPNSPQLKAFEGIFRS